MKALAEALQDKLAINRWQAIQQFSASNHSTIDSAQCGLLVKALADEHPFVRWQAGLVLAKYKIGHRLLADIVKNSGNTDAHYTNVTRAAAADALKASRSADVIPSLLEALGSEDDNLRQSITEALAAQKNRDLMPHLVQAARDNNFWVRRAAMYALGHVAKPDVVGPLLSGLQDSATLVRRSAAYALGTSKAKEAIPQLRQALSDTDPLVRRNAAWALGRIGAPEAIPDLSRLSTDPALYGTVAATAQQALDLITKPGWLQMLTTRIRSALISGTVRSKPKQLI